MNSRVAVADAEPDRSPARALRAEVPAGERLEERGRGQRRERQGHRRPEQPGDRRRDDAVGGRVVAAVPLAVPDREALLAEQLGAEGVGGEVDGARLPDQVDDREQQRDEQRRQPPPVDAPVQRAACAEPVGRAKRGPGATSRRNAARWRRDCGERGPEHDANRLAERPTQEARDAGPPRARGAGRPRASAPALHASRPRPVAAERGGVGARELGRRCTGRPSPRASARGRGAGRGARPPAPAPRAARSGRA